jgi:GNAT superfamily N-acetyltransferase
MKINIRAFPTNRWFTGIKGFWIRAFHGKKTVGTVGLLPDGFFHDLEVEPNYRLKGIATMLINKCEELSEKDIHFYRNEDTPIEFYKKLGFEKHNLKMIKRKQNETV